MEAYRHSKEGNGIMNGLDNGEKRSFEDTSKDFKELLPNFLKDIASKLDINVNEPVETKNDETRAEVYITLSTYGERIQQTPISGGFWEGDRGESKFFSFNDKVNEILKEFGIDGIEYKNGIPDFSPVSKGTVEIDFMSSDRYSNLGNFRQADIALAKLRGCSPEEIQKWREENGYTWHERNDMKTMDLIPREINSTFGHLGGVSECSKLMEDDDFDE